MSTGDWTDTAKAVLEIAQYVLPGLNLIALTAFGWMAKKYHGHISMLLRHDQALITNEHELGLLRVQRLEISKGVVGDKQTEVFKAIDHEIDNLRKEDEGLREDMHRVQIQIVKDHGELKGDLREIKGQLSLLLQRKNGE